MSFIDGGGSAPVRLRAVEPTDLPTFFDYEQDPEAARRSRFTPRDRAAFLSHWTDRVLADPTVLTRTVTVGDEIAGNVAAWWKGDRRYLGYWLGRRYWGRGVGSAMLALFLRIETTRPLWADPFAGNTGSVKVLEKNGFRRTGSEWVGDDEYVLLVLDGRAPGNEGW
ncbi:GNAT family N-acetyltransferase [Nocardia sp. CDC159]|uniref:GNAT family N-acetyltransferase n=1 Tax=Nocardia pulmonis TaxID=2951408 RepID=A0A9X2E366_9NOCA|nr:MULTISPECIES: GNAT family N-acetyltransferase [Nocardia]MCM6772005.1 GNAT family N-acetyltransferase [Nocardia pulmonis]MCM6785337.1 GNAT family N-acetyltransferase [Nocardia sp. CDC159]